MRKRNKLLLICLYKFSIKDWRRNGDQKRYDWENPAVIKRNKEDGHVIAFSYDNALDAAERKESPYKVTLNGNGNSIGRWA